MRWDVWTRDELILALALYFRIQARPSPGENHKDILRVVRMLHRVAEITPALRDKSRSASSLKMKLANFQSLDPAHIAKGKKGLRKGGSADREVWQIFSSDLSALNLVANGIVRALSRGEVGLVELNLDDTAEAPEGQILTRLHRVRERNPKIVAKKKLAVLRREGCLRCEVCAFDFSKKYGERGRNFIEVHHLLPLFAIAKETKTKLNDLACVCANCHRMIHARRQWLNINQLREIIDLQNGGQANK